MSDSIKAAIVGFILYVLYDNYMRSKTEKTYITQAQLDAAIAAKGIQINQVQYDPSSLTKRVSNLELQLATSPYQ